MTVARRPGGDNLKMAKVPPDTPNAPPKVYDELLVAGSDGVPRLYKMHRETQRVIGDDLSSAQAFTGARYVFKFSDTAEITDDVRFAFSLADSTDWRTSNIAALTAKLTTVLSLKLSNTVRYVHAPPDDFERTDTITAVALVAKF